MYAFSMISHRRISAIGFASSGRGVGKTTVAKALAKALAPRLRVRIVSFAAPLRGLVKETFDRVGAPVEEEQLLARKDKPLDWRIVRSDGQEIIPTGRDLLLCFGAAARGALAESVFAEIWARQAIECLYERTFIIADDVRFPVEAAAVRSVGGILVYLEAEDGVQGEAEGLIDPKFFEVIFKYEKTSECLDRLVTSLAERVV